MCGSRPRDPTFRGPFPDVGTSRLYRCLPVLITLFAASRTAEEVHEELLETAKKERLAELAEKDKLRRQKSEKKQMGLAATMLNMM